MFIGSPKKCAEYEGLMELVGKVENDEQRKSLLALSKRRFGRCKEFNLKVLQHENNIMAPIDPFHQKHGKPVSQFP